MSRCRAGRNGLLRAARRQWRSVCVGGLVGAVAMISCHVYGQGSPVAERAGLILGGTLIGMLVIAWRVCRR